MQQLLADTAFKEKKSSESITLYSLVPADRGPVFQGTFPDQESI